MAICGIDLGTTFSAVAVYENGKPVVIANSEGARTTPSVVAYLDNEILIGEPAKRQQVTSSHKTIHAAKRFIGMKRAEVEEEAKRVAYDVEAADSGNAVFVIGDKKVSPEEVGAKVLQKLKKAAEDYLGEEVKQAVITVPAYFDNAQRQATKNAGTIAGLEVLRVINEPTAAALAYGLNQDKEHKIIVIDCGGGTTDISLLEVGDDTVEVIGTSGDTHLGGEDFDTRLVDYLADEFKKNEGIDLRTDKMALQRLRTEAEKAKKELSSVAEVEVNIPFITADASGPRHLLIKVSRAKFEDLITDLVDRVFDCATTVLKDAKISAEEVDEVLFVGGSTRIPLISERSKSLFKKEPNRSVNPDEIVALGAAVQAGILAGHNSEVLLLDVTSLSLGIETLGGVMTVLIPRNTTIPSKKSQVFSTAADNQTSVNVRVAQGERPMYNDNQELGMFNLDGIPPATKGVPQIEVSFDIDANGIVSVGAKDLATGKDQQITIKSSSLPEEEIARMVKDAEEHAEADQKKLEEITKLNTLDSLVMSASRTLKENREQLDGQIDVETLEEALESAQKVLDDRDVDKVDETVNRLQEAAYKMAEVLYKANQPETETPVEAEVEIENEQAADIIDVEAEEAA